MLHMPALCNDRSTTTAQIKSLFPLKRQVGILIKKKKKVGKYYMSHSQPQQAQHELFHGRKPRYRPKQPPRKS